MSTAVEATPIAQVDDMSRPGPTGFFGTSYPDGRVYRCDECGEESPVVLDGSELRAWLAGHICKP